MCTRFKPLLAKRMGRIRIRPIPRGYVWVCVYEFGMTPFISNLSHCPSHCPLVRSIDVWVSFSFLPLMPTEYHGPIYSLSFSTNMLDKNVFNEWAMMILHINLVRVRTNDSKIFFLSWWIVTLFIITVCMGMEMTPTFCWPERIPGTTWTSKYERRTKGWDGMMK